MIRDLRRLLRRFRAPLPLLAVAASLLAGCGEDGPSGAVGPNDEISLLTNLPREGAAVEEAYRLLGYSMDMVSSERAFRVDFVPWDQFNVHRQVKNQAFVVDLSRGDDLARHVEDWLHARVPGRLEAREPFRLLLHDQFATGQTSFYAVGWTPGEVAAILAAADSTGLRREFEASVARGLTLTMFSMGEETDLPRQMARDFGWTLRLPDGFNAAGDPEGNFVKFNSTRPVRLVLVHWVEGGLDLDADLWNPVLERILMRYNDGDEVLWPRTESWIGTFLERPALRWEGIWQNEKYVIGGPFRAAAFHGATRSYLLVGMVYNPGGDKVPILRQVEAIMRTFREVE